MGDMGKGRPRLSQGAKSNAEYDTTISSYPSTGEDESCSTLKAIDWPPLVNEMRYFCSLDLPPDMGKKDSCIYFISSGVEGERQIMTCKVPGPVTWGLFRFPYSTALDSCSHVLVNFRIIGKGL